MEIKDLTSFEQDFVAGIFQEYYIKYSVEAKLEFLSKEIDEPRYKWMRAHGEFARETFEKLGVKLDKKDKQS